MKLLIFKYVNLVSVLLALVWFTHSPDWEPAITLIGLLSAFVATDLALTPHTRPQLFTKVKNKDEKWMDWPTYYSAISTLVTQISRRPELGGYRPHLVIGVNCGGAIVGGLFYYSLLRSFHFAVWTSDDCRVRTPSDQKNALSLTIKSLKKLPEEKLRILLVDDVFKTGTSVARIKSLIGETAEELKIKEEVEIKVAVVVYKDKLWNQSNGAPPNYYVHKDYTHFPYGEI